MIGQPRHGSAALDGARSLIATDAVVIGGGMAGLLAARVLADHVGRVTLLDRDRFPVVPRFRRGVPQSRHVHALLGRGLEVLEELFPGLEAELVDAGAPTIPSPRDVLWLTAAGWCRRFPPRLRLLSCSRDLLEWHIRCRVADLDNVRLMDGREAVGLLPSPEGTAVTGVRLRERGGPAGDTAPDQTIPATIVIDASGRTSRAPEWLAELGYPPPAETTVDAFLGYASRAYAIPPSFAADWRGMYLQAKPPATTRAGVLLPVEGNRWMVGLVGAGRDYPPTDEEGFLAFARSLRSPMLAEIIQRAEPLSPIYGNRQTANRRRQYEHAARRLEGFVVVGDAACTFNPVYGQGMTVAALAARALAEGLDQQRRRRQDGNLAGFAHRVQRRVATSSATAWLMATGEDLRYPETSGARPGLPTRLLQRYADGVLRAAMEDQRANAAFLDVLNLLAPPAALFRPGVLASVLRTAIRDRGSVASNPGPPPLVQVHRPEQEAP
ncbi:MAG: FAD-dependent monooxygenase [Chloroflexota bacterium]|nr:FAD-dependent monooxygenase [Chloroflexota bacterium]